MISDVTQCRKSAGIGVISGEPSGGEVLNILNNLRKGEMYRVRKKAEKGRTPSLAISCLTRKLNTLIRTRLVLRYIICSPLHAVNVNPIMFPNADMATRAGRNLIALSFPANTCKLSDEKVLASKHFWLPTFWRKRLDILGLSGAISCSGVTTVY